MKEVLVTYEEAGRRLSVGRSTIEDLVRADELRVIKVGRRRLIPATELEAFVERRYQTDRRQALGMAAAGTGRDG